MNYFNFFCVFGTFNIIESSLIWSKTYSLQAVLNVPSANISEPYQVWVDGDTGNSRIDFYNGLNKLYKLKSDTGYYNYYKIQPETKNNFINKEVCEQRSPNDSLINIYERNMYLPTKAFRYVGNEQLNGVQVQKWVFDQTLGYVSEFTYTIWVLYRKSSMSDRPITVPVRYEYQMKANNAELDYFRHEYSFFDDMKITSDVFRISSETQCTITNSTKQEADYSLIDFVDPVFGEDLANKAFESFKVKHNKTYSTEKEHRDRYYIFKNNLRFISSANRQYKSFSLAVNHLADQTDAELSRLFGIKDTEILKFENNSLNMNNTDNDDAREGSDSENFDWRMYGAITSVKDQTIMCGSCYAFTVAASLESSRYIVRGCKNLTEISEQVLVDCTWNEKGEGNRGCDGGTLSYTLNWIKIYGVPYKSKYGPYLAMEGLCHVKELKKFYKIDNYVRLRNKREIKESIRNNGPLIIALNARPKTFLFYSKGIYNDKKCEPVLNHGVAVIGYGKEDGQDYWILKNSYGTKWGDSGFMRIASNSNTCGIKNSVYKVEYKKKSQAKECFKKL